MASSFSLALFSNDRAIGESSLMQDSAWSMYLRISWDVVCFRAIFTTPRVQSLGSPYPSRCQRALSSPHFALARSYENCVFSTRTQQIMVLQNLLQWRVGSEIRVFRRSGPFSTCKYHRTCRSARPSELNRRTEIRCTYTGPPQKRKPITAVRRQDLTCPSKRSCRSRGEVSLGRGRLCVYAV